MRPFKYCCILIFLVLCSLPLSAAESGNMLHQMTTLVFQLAILIFAARIGGTIALKLRLPSVIGELTAGMLIGPYLLGHYAIPGFPQGLFPLQEGTVPVTSELYGIATIASIILLFVAGLETDIKLFLRYAVSGTIIGVGGLFASYLAGAVTGMIYFNCHFLDPIAMFLGVMSTATSVGITARTLSERRSMDTPEGVTILAGAVVDDVLGIILLAIVMGVTTIMHQDSGNNIPWGNIGFITIKAVGVWLGFTVAGILLSNKISRFLKYFNDKYVFTVLSFGFALFLSGIFEKAGLAMIIGAYVMGLSLSNTDISYVIQETMHPIKMFFVPIFFTVMGMMVNINTLFSFDIFTLGVIYAFGGILAKLIGCGLPALFMNFNTLGALRIGFGMAPRGEVVLIIAGIGLSSGILDIDIFGIAFMLIIISVIGSPPMLNILLKKRKKGIKREEKVEEIVTTSYQLPTHEHSEMIVHYAIHYFRKEGFFVNKMELDTSVFQIRKGEVFITFFYHPVQIVFKTAKENVVFVETIVTEAFYKLYDTINTLKSFKPRDMRAIISPGIEMKRSTDIAQILQPENIIVRLKSKDKERAIAELVNKLAETGKIKNKTYVLEQVMKREHIMSTGMQKGFACPHCRIEEIDNVKMALGISKEGIEFDTLDDLPAKVIFLVILPTKDVKRHTAVMSHISAMLHREGAITHLTRLQTPKEILAFFKRT